MGGIKNDYIISDNYKDLINSDIYEKIILYIMNMSTMVFPGKYKHIDDQSHGESDFISLSSGELFDAKTIFSQKQCEYLSMGNLNGFYEIICNETNEVFEAIMEQGKELNSTILYKNIIRTFDKISPAENVILFIPYQFTLEFEGSIASQLGSDIFSQIIYGIKKDKPCFFRNHKVYLIYPNLENKIILRDLSNGNKEYLKSNIISNYIYVKW